MNVNIDIARIKQKTTLLIPDNLKYAFERDFDNEIAFDLIENTEDFLAEGIAIYYMDNYTLQKDVDL